MYAIAVRTVKGGKCCGCIVYTKIVKVKKHLKAFNAAMETIYVKDSKCT